MSKREIYNQLVAEVEADKALINSTTTAPSYKEVVAGETTAQMSLPQQGVSLKTPTSAFADYAIRDALLVEALKDEEFAFVLINKIGNDVHDKVEAKSVTQDDVEALATAGNLLTMWEQFGSAVFMLSLLEETVEEYKLQEPTINGLTKKLLESADTFPFSVVRNSSVADLYDKSQKGLDE